MADLQEPWKVHQDMRVEGATREERAANLRQRFSAVSERSFVKTRRARMRRQAGLVVLIALAIFLVWKLIETFSPWPVTLTLRHLASFPACEAANAMGLAPARRGEPGYWLRLDGDNDGMACELYFNPETGPLRFNRL